MNQTGTYGTGRPRAARTNAESAGVGAADGGAAGVGEVTCHMVPRGLAPPRGAAIDDGQR
jgi:hypothetical protein